MVGLAWVVPNFPIGLGRSYFPIGLRNPMNNNSDGFAIAGAMNVQNVRVCLRISLRESAAQQAAAG